MAPFVPDIISEQLNLVVALFLGIGFGFVLEQAGFSSSRKLAGVFYGYDFTVLRVFFTAAVTAMSGVLLLGYFGWLDLDAIYVNPTWLWPAIVGGAIMGLGFVLGGYCPGTSLCAAAIGKVDAMFFVLGGLLGVFAFGELFPLYENFYVSSSLGSINVFDSLGISGGWFAFGLIVVAVTAFVFTTWIEIKVNPTAPSWDFKASWHRKAAVGVLILGAVLAFLPDRKTQWIEQAFAADYQAAHPVKVIPADELAFRIIDRERNVQIVDIRSPEQFTSLALPGSRNIAVKDFFSKDNTGLFARRHVKKVVVGEDEAESKAACLLLEKLGFENVAALEGGFRHFRSTILDSTAFVPMGNRWDNDVKTFRESARIEIRNMIEAAKNTTPKAAKKEKKVRGGC
ncbi:sulfurtransferase [candidate division KSB1 bacterium]|nr:MAG: sulfurtransferase [candidate division KSB1 bacterium]